MPTIEERVAALATADRVEALKTIGLFLAELEHGTIRAAMRDADGIWQVQPWIKLGILAAFKFGVAAEFASGSLSFVDKDTIPPRRFKAADGVIINASTPIYDAVRGQIYRREIPYGAVVIPGSRPMKGAFADEHRLSMTTPVIVKYRDEKTDSSTALEEALR